MNAHEPLQFNFFPFPELNTTRLMMRRIDAAALYLLRTDDAVMQYLDREKAASISEIEILIDKIGKDIDNNESITWAIALKEEPPKLIGHIGFWSVTKAHHRAEIGYSLHPAFWNRGLVSEALNEVIRFGFLQLHSIEAHINPGNLASAKVLEKAGFTRDAYFKESFLFNGKFLDTVVYSLVTNSRI